LLLVLFTKCKSSFFCCCLDKGLNSGFWTCKAGMLPLEHTSSPFCSGYFFGDGVLLIICPD
jgi:hypothetical protein